MGSGTTIRKLVKTNISERSLLEKSIDSIGGMQYLLNDNGIGREVMSPTDKAASDGFPVRFSIGNQYDGGIEMEKEPKNEELQRALASLRNQNRRETADQILEKILKGKSFIALENRAKEIIETDKLVREYIYHCASYYQTNHPRNEVPLTTWLTDESAIEAIEVKKALILKRIETAGGHYDYFKQNRRNFLSRFPCGVPPSIKQLAWLIRGPDNFSIEEIDLNEINSGINSPADIPFTIWMFNSIIDKINELESNQTAAKNQRSKTISKKNLYDLNYGLTQTQKTTIKGLTGENIISRIYIEDRIA